MKAWRFALLCLLKWSPLAFGKTRAQSQIYNETFAKIMVDFAGAAYDCVENNCEKWNCTLCGKYPDTVVKRLRDDIKNANGFVGYVESLQAIVLAFAGSSRATRTNWGSDLTITWHPYSYCTGCYVHSGFYETYISIRQQLVDSLNYLISQYPAVPIYVTGHSLGGALSVLATVDMLSQYQLPVKSIITFGAPRVGDDDFTNFYRVKVEEAEMKYNFRVVNASDPVVHLPPYAIGYRHQEIEVFYIDDKTFKQCDPLAEDPTCSNSMRSEAVHPRDHMHYLGLDFGKI